MPTISPITEIIAEMAAGKMVVLLDDEDRENEGDLVMAAEHVQPEHINFMATHGRGLICLTLTANRCEQLRLPLMVSRNDSPYSTNFTVSIEAAEGVTTGISAADRATTVQAAIADDASREHITMPGHIFPLRAQDGGVLMRAGHTEAACDLARLAGCKPYGVLCEILNEDGSMARLPDLLPYAEKHGLKVGLIADLIAYRRSRESTVKPLASSPYPIGGTTFTLHAFENLLDGEVHFALALGTLSAEQETLVRVHGECPLDDRFHSESSVRKALEHIAEHGHGVLLYLHRSFNAEEWTRRMHDLAYRAQGVHTPKPEQETLRGLGLGAQMLAHLDVHKVRLLTNSERKLQGLRGFGLEILGREPFIEDGDTTP